jgi:hypothetical protein
MGVPAHMCQALCGPKYKVPLGDSQSELPKPADFQPPQYRSSFIFSMVTSQAMLKNLHETDAVVKGNLDFCGTTLK